MISSSGRCVNHSTKSAERVSALPWPCPLARLLLAPFCLLPRPSLPFSNVASLGSSQEKSGQPSGISEKSMSEKPGTALRGLRKRVDKDDGMFSGIPLPRSIMFGCATTGASHSLAPEQGPNASRVVCNARVRGLVTMSWGVHERSCCTVLACCCPRRVRSQSRRLGSLRLSPRSLHVCPCDSPCRTSTIVLGAAAGPRVPCLPVVSRDFEDDSIL